MDKEQELIMNVLCTQKYRPFLMEIIFLGLFFHFILRHISTHTSTHSPQVSPLSRRLYKMVMDVCGAVLERLFFLYFLDLEVLVLQLRHPIHFHGNRLLFHKHRIMALLQDGKEKPNPGRGGGRGERVCIQMQWFQVLQDTATSLNKLWQWYMHF